MFLGWYGAPEIETGIPGLDVEGIAEAAGIDTSVSAWQAFDFIDIVLAVTIVVAVGLALMSAMAQTVALPVAASSITAGLGILSTLLVLYRVIDTPYDLDRKFWLFVGLVLTAGIAYGGWRAMQEEGSSFGGEADRVGGSGGSDEPPPPPPPPPSGTPPSSTPPQGPAA